MAAAITATNKKPTNLETYCLIWVDSHVNSSSDNLQAQNYLKSLIHHLITFQNDHECLQYLKNLPRNDRAILITSGQSGRNLVPQITQLKQITSIYIYCMDKKANEQWSQPFPKVKGVVTRLNELVEIIRTGYLYQQNTKLDENLLIKIYDDQSTSSDQFFSSQLLIDCLLRLNSYSNEKNDLISFCIDYYHNNPHQYKIIKEFNHSYNPERVFWWFTRYSFLSRLLNKALCEENWDLLVQFRFILHDIGCQLGKNRCSSLIHVYRSQLMDKDEIEILKNSIGKYLSINSFLLTSINAEQTRSLLYSINSSSDYEKVFFKIEADPRLPNSRPFSDIQSLSYSTEIKQILFMIGSIFRIQKVKYDERQIWNIQLILSSIKDSQLKPIFRQLKHELGMGQTNVFQFASLLYRTDKIEQSEKYFRRYLNQLPNNHPDLYNSYQALARIAESKKNFPSSLKWHKISLHICRENEKVSNGNQAEIYSNIGMIYMKMKDYNRAKKFIEKALDIFENISPNDPSHTIKCLNNLGGIYDMKQEYAEALKYYQKALEIAKKTKDSQIVKIIRNIANIYELQGQFQQALDYYKTAMKISCKSSSSNSNYIQDIDASIRRVSSKLK